MGESKPDVDVVLPTGLYRPVDDLCIVTSYFNPAGYRTRRANYELFAERIIASGLRLFVIECALGGAPFELPAAPHIMQVRARAALWHKERLLNLVIARLPRECAKVAWLDADVVFENPNWAVETSRRLERHAFVQPFEHPLRLLEGNDRAKSGWLQRSFAATLLSDPTALGGGDGARHGETGLAWAAQRRVVAHGLYDGSIVGGGDHVMAHGMCGEWSSRCIDRIFGRDSAYRRHARRWGRGIPRQAHGDVGYVEGAVFHLFHGDYAKREYTERHALLQSFGYDPTIDLRTGSDGCLEWASAKPALQHWVGDYFARRDEDGAASRTLAEAAAQRA